MSGDDLEQMYQEVILEAARDPHGREHFATDVSKEQGSAPADTTVRASHEYCTPGESHQFNPTCGDEATVHAEVSDSEPHTIERLVWDGHGCSISQASLSVMVDLCAGKTVDEAMELFRDFHELMESRGAGLQDEAKKRSWRTPWCSRACPSTRCASSARCLAGRACATPSPRRWRRNKRSPHCHESGPSCTLDLTVSRLTTGET